MTDRVIIAQHRVFSDVFQGRPGIFDCIFTNLASDTVACSVSASLAFALIASGVIKGVHPAKQAVTGSLMALISVVIATTVGYGLCLILM